MIRTSWLDVGGEDDLPELLWEDGDRRFCRIWRKGADGARRSMLAVLPATEHRTPGSISRLAHEYELQEYLDSAWALRPVELVREQGRTMLVVDYAGGGPLDHLTREPLEIARSWSGSIPPARPLDPASSNRKRPVAAPSTGVRP